MFYWYTTNMELQKQATSYYSRRLSPVRGRVRGQEVQVLLLEPRHVLLRLPVVAAGVDQKRKLVCQSVDTVLHYQGQLIAPQGQVSLLFSVMILWCFFQLFLNQRRPEYWIRIAPSVIGYERTPLEICLNQIFAYVLYVAFLSLSCDKNRDYVYAERKERGEPARTLAIHTQRYLCVRRTEQMS